MHEHILLQIGKKIRSLRQGNGMTIQVLADRAQVSKGLISKIENGRTVPSLPVLLSIIKGLNADAPSFFEGIEFVRYDGYVHKRPEDYVPVEKEPASGYLYLSIIQQSFSNFSLEIDLLELAPGAERSLVSTDGYEFLYILEGDVHYILGDQTLILRKGESLFFNGSIPHKPTNPGAEKVRFLVVFLLMPAQD
jgi:transcriptional regulator with XRE-family HTH domain